MSAKPTSTSLLFSFLASSSIFLSLLGSSVAAASSCQVSATTPNNILLNGDFELPKKTSAVYAAPANWTCPSGCVIVPQLNSAWGYGVPSNLQYLALQGSGSKFSQVVHFPINATTPAALKKYTLTFYARNRVGSFVPIPFYVSLNGKTIWGPMIVNETWTEYTVPNINATTAAVTLLFGNQNGLTGDRTTEIDYVSLRPSCLPPLPPLIENCETIDQFPLSITVRPGHYRFSSGKYFYLQRFSNFQINAYNVTFHFFNVVGFPFTTYYVSNAAINGLTVQFNQPQFSQGKVINVTAINGAHLVEWEVDYGYPTAASALQMTLMNVIDPNTMRIRFGVYDLSVVSYKNLTNCDVIPTISNGLPKCVYQVKFTTWSIPHYYCKVGDWLVLRTAFNSGSFHLAYSTNVVLNNCHTKYAGFGAFFETNGGGNSILNCTIGPGPMLPTANVPPIVGNGADGIHSNMATKGLTIKGLRTYGVLLDDCIAIHGKYTTVASSYRNTVVLTSSGNANQFIVGQPVRITNYANFYLEATLLAVNYHNATNPNLTISFAGTNVKSIPYGSHLSNPLWNGPGFHISDCVIGNTRARGIIVKADNGVIVNNRISDVSINGIKVGPESYIWLESDYVNNLYMAHNTFVNVSQSILLLNAEGSVGHRNISFEKNIMYNVQAEAGLEVGDIRGLKIVDNVFVNPDSNSNPSTYYSIAYEVQNVQFSGNTAVIHGKSTNVDHLWPTSPTCINSQLVPSFVLYNGDFKSPALPTANGYAAYQNPTNWTCPLGGCVMVNAKDTGWGGGTIPGSTQYLALHGAGKSMRQLVPTAVGENVFTQYNLTFFTRNRPGFTPISFTVLMGSTVVFGPITPTNTWLVHTVLFNHSSRASLDTSSSTPSIETLMNDLVMLTFATDSVSNGDQTVELSDVRLEVACLDLTPTMMPSNKPVTKAPSNESSSSSLVLSTNAIIGIAVGGGVTLLIVLGLACYCCVNQVGGENDSNKWENDGGNEYGNQRRPTSKFLHNNPIQQL